MCSNCNSLVCYTCLEKLGEHLNNNLKNTVSCSDCHQVLSLIPIQKITRKGLDMLRVKCPSNDLNCFQQINLKDLNTHLESCNYYQGKAKCNACFIIGSFNFIQNHIRNCTETLNKCKFCNEIVKKKLIKEHEIICAKKPSKCNVCSVTFDEMNIDYHPTKDVCITNIVNELRNLIDGKINIE